MKFQGYLTHIGISILLVTTVQGGASANYRVCTTSGMQDVPSTVQVAMESDAQNVERQASDESISGGVPTLGSSVRSMVTDAQGYLYAANSSSQKIQKYDSSGKLVKGWQLRKTGEGTGVMPIAIAISPDQSIYVGYAEGIVQKYDHDGKFILEWKSAKEKGESQSSLAVDCTGNIYVCMGFTPYVRKFSADGKLLSEIVVHNANDSPLMCTGIAIGMDNKLYVSAITDDGQTIEKCDLSGKVLLSWTPTSDGTMGVGLVSALAVDKGSNVYIGLVIGKTSVSDKANISIDTDSPRLIQKYDSNGKAITQWKLLNLQKGEALDIGSICVGSNSSVYVAIGGMMSATRIRKFESTGKFLAGWLVEQ